MSTTLTPGRGLVGDFHLEARIILPDGTRWKARAEYVPPGPGASVAILARRSTYGGRKGRSAARRLNKNTWVRGSTYTLEPADV